MAKQDYYEVLGIKKGASEDEIKKAYRANVKKHHPDSNPGDESAEAKFKEINEAYTVLSDADKRAKYDQFGHAATDGGFGGGYGGGYGGFDFSDIFSELGFGFGGGGRHRRRGPAPGDDIEISMQISFEDSIFGIEKEISYSIRETCETCRGTGAKPGTAPESCKACNGRGQVRQTMQTPLGVMETSSSCRACKGSGKIIREQCTSCNAAGKVNKRKTIAVHVPKGIDHGQSIKYTGQGEVGDLGAPRGDLFVRILVVQSKKFARRGNNLYAEREISFAQAALGGEIAIETPYGEEKHNINAGTQPESTITLRGKGVPVLNSNRAGDLNVTLKVVVPRNLTDTQRELLRQFAEEDGEKIEGKRGIFGRNRK